MCVKNCLTKITIFFMVFLIMSPVSLFSEISLDASKTWGGRIKSLEWESQGNIESLKIEILNSGKGEEKYLLKVSLLSVANSESNAQAKRVVLKEEERTTFPLQPRKTRIYHMAENWKNDVKRYDQSFSYYAVVELCEAGFPHRVISKRRIDI